MSSQWGSSCSRGGGTRTPNRWFWRPVLCQIELRPYGCSIPRASLGTNGRHCNPDQRSNRHGSSTRPIYSRHCAVESSAPDNVFISSSNVSSQVPPTCGRVINLQPTQKLASAIFSDRRLGTGDLLSLLPCSSAQDRCHCRYRHADPGYPASDYPYQKQPTRIGCVLGRKSGHHLRV